MNTNDGNLYLMRVKVINYTIKIIYVRLRIKGVWMVF